MLVDHSPAFNQANAHYKPDTDLALWLMVQPTRFNVIVRPGISLAQLRFFSGPGARLTAEELLEEQKRNPFMYEPDSHGELHRAQPVITDDGAQIDLDLKGVHSKGIVGLRARHNPEAIDLAREKHYAAADFFEPMKADKDEVIVEPDESYIFASRQHVRMPPHLNATLARFSPLGMYGPLEFSDLADQSFDGNLTFQTSPNEATPVVLRHGMPVTSLIFHHTTPSDKQYGKDIGSNYQGTKGLRTPKYFGPFNFDHAARNHQKLERVVLTQEAGLLTRHRVNREGFEPIDTERARALLQDVESGFWHSRYDCEGDERVLQPIPYLLFFDQQGDVFSYVRAADIKDFGDERLFGKHSIGVGGHVGKVDEPSSGRPSIVLNCINREFKEEVKVNGRFSEPLLAGTMMAYESPVDRVHFGLVYVIRTTGPVEPNESALASGAMRTIAGISRDPDYSKKYENWSRLLVPHLGQLENNSRAFYQNS